MMFPVIPEYNTRIFGSRSIAAWIGAILGSMIIHTIILVVISYLNLQVPFLSLVKTIPKKEKEAIHVSDVKVPSQKSEHTIKTTAPGTGTGTIEREQETYKQSVSHVLLEPPRIDKTQMAGESGSLLTPQPEAQIETSRKHHEIIAITEPRAIEDVHSRPRSYIPFVERAKETPDIVIPAEREETRKSTGTTQLPSDTSGGRLSVGLRGTATQPGTPGYGEGKLDTQIPKEALVPAKQHQPVEKLLKVNLRTYASDAEPGVGYFLLQIERAAADVLPVLPKDMLFVQDASASIAEERLYFCRQALTNCIKKLNPVDRFNVVSFREQTEFCFSDWVNPTPQTIEQASYYIDRLRPAGNTDIFGAMKQILEIKRIPGRPMIVLLITDGKATAGLTQSSEIIAQFSNANKGAVSVFVLGTTQLANWYLIGFLGYCNRGDSIIVTSGRWDIPKYIEGLMAEISRPVLTDLSVWFARATNVEAYPVMLSNLYLDRPLAICGKYPLSVTNLIFQIVGKAGEKDCDMVFNIDIKNAGAPGNKEIRTEWARQKIYHMIAECVKNPQQSLREEIKRLSRIYKLPVPFEGKY
jgi:hypothetical protein